MARATRTTLATRTEQRSACARSPAHARSFSQPRAQLQPPRTRAAASRSTATSPPMSAMRPTYVTTIRFPYRCALAPDEITSALSATREPAMLALSYMVAHSIPPLQRQVERKEPAPLWQHLMLAHGAVALAALATLFWAHATPCHQRRWRGTAADNQPQMRAPQDAGVTSRAHTPPPAAAAHLAARADGAIGTADCGAKPIVEAPPANNAASLRTTLRVPICGRPAWRTAEGDPPFAKEP